MTKSHLVRRTPGTVGQIKEREPTLDTIVTIKQDKLQDVERLKKVRPLATVQALAEEQSLPLCMIDALPLHGNALFGDCRRINATTDECSEAYDAVSLALYYQRMRAVAVLVSTDEVLLGGSLQDLRAVSGAVEIPVVRRDFIVDEYQIYQSRALGADSLVLVAGLLDEAECQYFIEISRELGMEAILQVYDQTSLDVALRTDAKVYYVSSHMMGLEQGSAGQPWTLAKRLKSVRRHAMIIGDSGTQQEGATLLAESRLCSALVLAAELPASQKSTDKRSSNSTSSAL